jgi:hypothetical protein
VKAAPKSGDPLLAVEEVLVRLDGQILCACYCAANELLVITHPEHERSSCRKALQNALKQIRNVVVRPRLVSLKAREANLAGTYPSEPVG